MLRLIWTQRNEESSMFIVRTVILWMIISTIINAYLMTLPIPVLRKRNYPANYLPLLPLNMINNKLIIWASTASINESEARNC